MWSWETVHPNQVQLAAMDSSLKRSNVLNYFLFSTLDNNIKYHYYFSGIISFCSVYVRMSSIHTLYCIDVCESNQVCRTDEYKFLLFFPLLFASEKTVTTNIIIHIQRMYS